MKSSNELLLIIIVVACILGIAVAVALYIDAQQTVINYKYNNVTTNETYDNNQSHDVENVSYVDINKAAVSNVVVSSWVIYD